MDSIHFPKRILLMSVKVLSIVSRIILIDIPDNLDNFPRHSIHFLGDPADFPRILWITLGIVVIC